MSECYIEFGLMANSVELARARVNVGHFHQYDFDMGQKWLHEGNGVTRSSFEKPNPGNQGQINITVKMHLVIRPVETISIQIGMRAIGKLRICLCCTLMCFLSRCSEAYNILGIAGIE